MKGSRSAFPVKPAALVILGCALFLALLYLGQRLSRLEVFRVKQIISRDALPFDLSHLEGENIFGVDLKKESKALEALYPGYKRIRLIKVFPDRIFADGLKRSAVAYLRLQRYFCIDEEMVLFNPAAQLESGLPLILGLERRIPNPSAGARVNLRELSFALSLIKEARQEPVLRAYPIKTISVPGLSNASFSIAEGLEIRISQEQMGEKLDILNSLLAQEKDRVSGIKYIDLRFKEPVIKLKNAD